MLSRNTSTPHSISSASFSEVAQAGPIVATVFVREFNSNDRLVNVPSLLVEFN